MKRTCFAALLAGCLAAVSSALGANLSFVNVPNFYNTKLTINAPELSETINGVETGFYQYTLDGGKTVVNSFCIDFYQYAPPKPPTSEPYTAAALSASPVVSGEPGTVGDVAMGSTAAGQIEQLWAKYYTLALGNAYDAAALQLAIWKAIAEGNGGTVVAVDNTDPGTPNDLNATADAWISGLKSTDPAACLFAWTSPDWQDYIGIGVPDGGATVALLGVALTGLAFLRRKS